MRRLIPDVCLCLCPHIHQPRAGHDSVEKIGTERGFWKSVPVSDVGQQLHIVNERVCVRNLSPGHNLPQNNSEGPLNNMQNSNLSQSRATKQQRKSYHIGLVVVDAVANGLRRHPFDGQFPIWVVCLVKTRLVHISR